MNNSETTPITAVKFESLSQEDANALVIEHQSWAEGVAKGVARAWNLDWRNDGLDGAALEALLFCARRFQPGRGVPFRGYARKRIHESATEAARKCRGWRKSTSVQDSAAREISAELLNVFPELRSGELPNFDDGDGGDDSGRGSIRQLLIGASILAVKNATDGSAEDLIDQKRMITFMSGLDLVHQWLLWKIYWEGSSLRMLATEWETDELNVIREHKILLAFLMKRFSKGRPPPTPKIRPGLRTVAARIGRDPNSMAGPFARFASEARQL